MARVYNGLPVDVRSKTAIFAQNYGQAGAIDLSGPKFGLQRRSAATRVTFSGDAAALPARVSSSCKGSKSDSRAFLQAW